MNRKSVLLLLVFLAVGLPLALFEAVSLRLSLVLFFGGTALLIASIAGLSRFVLAPGVRTERVIREFRWSGASGVAVFVAGMIMLSGVYLRYAFMGEMGVRWIIFWPLITAACLFFLWGMYQKIVVVNLNTFKRWEPFLGRSGVELRSLGKYLIDEVILQKQLRRESTFRWVRHILIFWGFVLLWLVDFTFAIFTEYMPIFGWHPAPEGGALRLTFDFLLDFLGAMVLLGTVLALLWRVRISGTDKKIYTDTPTVAFLLLVLSTGYLVEGLRLAALPDSPAARYSLLGYGLASLFRGSGLPLGLVHQGMWLFHVIASSAFIAYFPVKRLVHSCATPVGKLMQSQKLLLESKVRGVVRGLLQLEKTSFQDGEVDVKTDLRSPLNS
jgi:nitrate reductase gamma subunit